MKRYTSSWIEVNWAQRPQDEGLRAIIFVKMDNKVNPITLMQICIILDSNEGVLLPFIFPAYILWYTVVQ